MNISPKHLTVDGHIQGKVWVMWNGKKHCTGAVSIFPLKGVYVDLWRNGEYVTRVHQDEIEKSISHAHNIRIPAILFINRDNCLA